MKRKYRIIFWALLLSGLFFACQSDTVLIEWPDRFVARYQKKVAKKYLNQGVVAFWTFDELGVTELLRRGRNVNYGTLLTQGRYGKGRLFNGRTSNHIETQVAWRDLGSQYTISCWVKIRASSPNQAIVFSHSGGRKSGIMLREKKMIFQVPYTDYQIASYPFEKYDEFVHLAAVVDLSQRKATLYENGVLKSSINISGVHHVRGLIEYGKYRPIKVYFPLSGILDETIIWTRALSPREVLALYHSKTSRQVPLAPMYSLKLRMAKSIRLFFRSSLKYVDYFNPFIHQSRIFKSDLPQFNLILSKSDIKYFNKAKNQLLEKGYAIKKALRDRKIEVAFNNKTYQAKMSVYGTTPRHWTTPQKSFTITLRSSDGILGMKRILFTPPEVRGLLRPLLLSYLGQKYGLAYPRSSIGIVRVNGEFQGLYYFGDHFLHAYHETTKDNDFIALVDRLPLPMEVVLKDYESLASKYQSLLINDKYASLSSREIEYLINRDRHQLNTRALRSSNQPPGNILQKATAYLTERRLLNGNPSPDYIINDLNLDVLHIPDVTIQWHSSNSELLNHLGKVRRPDGKMPVQVTLEATISDGKAAEKKALQFTIMPEVLKLPALRLIVPHEITNSNRTACWVELIEESGFNQSGLLPGKIKFRGNTALYYPKKSYALRMKTPHGFMDFSDSRDLRLMSSYVDRSFMKNKLVYDIFRSFSEENAPRFSPKVHLVELFMNDEYQGIYELSEKVDRFLLGLNKFRKDDSVHSVIYKAVGRNANFQRITRGAYIQKEPKRRYGEYWKPYEDLVRFIGTAPTEVFRRDVANWIDIGNVIDFQIIVNFAYNKDGPKHNLFLARNNKKNARFFIVPWDYDKTFGLEHTVILSNFLFDRLLRELPGYKEALKERWRGLRRDQLSERKIMQRIDRIDEDLRGSVERNFRRWPVKGITHDGEVKRIKGWIHKRLLFMDTYIQQM